MLQEFITQQYLIIEQNVVTNVVMWNGDTTQWTPPQGPIAIPQSTTPAMLWEAVTVDKKITDWILAEQIGAGATGFTWDGSVLTTNEPKPEIPIYSSQPETTGTVTA